MMPQGIVVLLKLQDILIFARCWRPPPTTGSMTFGLAALQPDDTAEDMIARADDELYRARQRHRAAGD